MRKFLLWIWPTIQKLYLRFGILVIAPNQRVQGTTFEEAIKSDLVQRRQAHSEPSGAHAHHHHKGGVPGGHSHVLLLVLLAATVTHAQNLTDAGYAKAVQRREQLREKFDRDQARYVQKHQKLIDEYQGLVDRIAAYDHQHAPTPPPPPAPPKPEPAKEEPKPDAK